MPKLAKPEKPKNMPVKGGGGNFSRRGQRHTKHATFNKGSKKRS